MGGMVFGRDLASATRDTRVISPEPVAYDASGRRTLEHRLMPALVVRCVIHLKKWGLDEEGIFRLVKFSAEDLYLKLFLEYLFVKLISRSSRPSLIAVC
jgi:hypothetical protein